MMGWMFPKSRPPIAPDLAREALEIAVNALAPLALLQQDGAGILSDGWRDSYTITRGSIRRAQSARDNIKRLLAERQP